MNASFHTECGGAVHGGIAGSLLFPPSLNETCKIPNLLNTLLGIFGNGLNREEWVGETSFSKISHRCYSSVGTLG